MNLQYSDRYTLNVLSEVGWLFASLPCLYDLHPVTSAWQSMPGAVSRFCWSLIIGWCVVEIFRHLFNALAVLMWCVTRASPNSSIRHRTRTGIRKWLVKKSYKRNGARKRIGRTVVYSEIRFFR